MTMLAQYIVTRTKPRFGFDRHIAAESARFSLPLAFANLLSWLLLSIDNLIVARVMNPVDLGLYVLAFNVSSWPMSAIGSSIRVVALPVFSQLGSKEQRNAALVGVSGSVWAVSILMGVLLSTLAAPIVSTLYGDRWLGAVGALVGLAVFGAFRVVFDLLATFLVAAGETREVLAVQVWWLVVLIPAMYFGVTIFGLAGAGWAHVAVGLVAVLPAYLLCIRQVGVAWVAFLKGWIRPSLAVLPAAFGCWWIGENVHSPILALLLGGSTALVLYVLPIARWSDWPGRIVETRCCLKYFFKCPDRIERQELDLNSSGNLATNLGDGLSCGSNSVGRPKTCSTHGYRVK